MLFEAYICMNNFLNNDKEYPINYKFYNMRYGPIGLMRKNNTSIAC